MRKPLKGKSLAETHPEVAKQWHPKLNGNLRSNHVTPRSNKKIWWKCSKGDDHEWLSQLNSRTGLQEQNYPICSNKKVALSNYLATTNPELAEQWHLTKNGSLTRFNIVKGFYTCVWWK